MTPPGEGYDERLAAFAGQVSHDLKNPLSAIRMSLELARDELGDEGDPDLLVLLGRAQRGADRMDVLIDDLTVFAHTGPVADRSEVDLASLVVGVLDELGDAVSPGQVRGVDDLPAVTGDPRQLRTVVRHLLDNALRFSSRDAPVEVSAERIDGGWRVAVADRGSGVPRDERERVFEPLVRLDRSVPGTGFGLATCRRIVAGHGGRIGIDGRAGGGAVVWFELPD